jgi:AcrR family transcriptional regulator
VTTEPRRRYPARERRVQIEDAAARLFARDGYEATTMDDIAAAVGVTKPVLYRHFASKKELHLFLLRRHRHELATAALDELAAAADRPVADRVRAMIAGWFAHIEREPYARMLFADTTGDPDVRAVLDELHGLQRAADVALLRELAPHIPSAELEPLGEALRSSLSGLALWWGDHPEVARGTLVDAMVRVALGLLPRG